MSQLLSRFIVMSDLHFMAWLETDEPTEWVPLLHEYLDDAYSLAPEFLIINGDLTNGKERDYRKAMPALQEHCPVPTYFTMGNHEYYGYYEDEDFSQEGAQRRFLEFTKSPSIHQTATIANHSFIFMSTERYTPELKDSGWLTPELLAWFDEQLKAANSGPKFVFFHQPVNGTVANSGHTCWQSDELQEILGRHQDVLFFTGHTHCNMDRDDQLAVQNGTVFVGGGCLLKDKPQSRYVELYDDCVKLRIRDHANRQWLESYDTTLTFPVHQSVSE